ncbi:unnamed protein product [Orchesella dallaii]|uniref:Uncharacterized protein n=1 Tax=Orchesella dallaii TaxID=48710 RepID=A0ABP1S242_9HEXA
MEPTGRYIIYIGESGTNKLNCECSSIQIIRKRRRTVPDDERNCPLASHTFKMMFQYPILVAFTTFLILCFIPYPTHALPFVESLTISGDRDSLSNSHRSHNVDLLIDPIHQAEYGDEELESKKVVAKSVFDMVLRTPPPPTSSYTRCPPGTQSPFEGGPCITKSTDPVAFVDQSFLLDTLRGLTKDGVLLGGGSTRTRRPGGNNRRRPLGRPKIPLTPASITTATTTTQQPITTTITEIPPETTFMHTTEASGQTFPSSLDIINHPESMKMPATNFLKQKFAAVEVMKGDRNPGSELNDDDFPIDTTAPNTFSEKDQEMKMSTSEMTKSPTRDDSEREINGLASNDRPHLLTVSKFTDAVTTAIQIVSPDTLKQLKLTSPPERTSLKQTAEIVPSRVVGAMKDVKETLSVKPISLHQNNVTAGERENDDALNRDGNKRVETFIIRSININNTQINLKQFKNDQFDVESDQQPSPSITYSTLREKEVERPLLDPDTSLSTDNITTFDRKLPIEDKNKLENKAKVLISTNEGLKKAVSADEKQIPPTQPEYVDHSSVAIVNHLSQLTVAEDEIQDIDMEGVSVDFQIMDATSTFGDIVAINNHTISQEDEGKNRKEQVRSNSSVDEGITIGFQKSSSSKNLEKPGDQIFSTEMEIPEFQTTLIFPSTTESSPLHPKDTLLQFQLPIVTKGGIGFLHEASTESVRGSTSRNTLRPLLLQDFQLDYPPKEFLRSNHPVLGSGLVENSAKAGPFKVQKQQEWETVKPFPSVIPSPTGDTSLSSKVSDYDTGSTEYLESELDRRHQKTRSRNRMKSFEATTYQPNRSMFPEFIRTFYPTTTKPHQHTLSSPSQQQFFYPGRILSSDIDTFGYVNTKHGDHRLNSNRHKIIW